MQENFLFPMMLISVMLHTLIGGACCTILVVIDLFYWRRWRPWRGFRNRRTLVYVWPVEGQPTHLQLAECNALAMYIHRVREEESPRVAAQWDSGLGPGFQTLSRN